jgi:outer membrane protein, heavy metal efflux system
VEIDMNYRNWLFAGIGLAASTPLWAQSLSLADALRSGVAQAPRLAAQRYAVISAGHQIGRAAELPDPRLKLGLENLPVSGTNRFRYDTDFMTQRTVGISQEFPSLAKRAARNSRATKQRDLEDATLAAQGTVLQRDIAVAWLDAYYAEQSHGVLAKLADQFRLQSDLVPPAIARGRQTAAEGFALRTAFEQANDRIIEQDRARTKTRLALAAFIGDDAKRPLGAPPDTVTFAHPFEHLMEKLADHPSLRVFDQREALARAEVDLARSTRERDWNLEVGYSQRRPNFDNMVSVVVAIDLPIAKERRQDLDVASKLAEVELSIAQREDARRMHEAEIRSLHADWATAQKRLQRFASVLLPLANERAQAALAAYRGGRGELGAVLEAQRALTETELARIQAEADRSRAWAGLNYLYPPEHHS